MLAYHGEKDETANKCSSGPKESSTSVSSSLLVSRDIKSTTTFSFPIMSTIVMSNYWSNSNHIVTLALVMGLFIKYLIDVWSLCINVGYLVM